MIYPDTDTLQFIRQHENDDIRQLALRMHSHTTIDIHFALRQIAGRQIARNKIPSWYCCEGVIYSLHISMEQCSSEKTASYKAKLCKGNTLVDLTGGLGVDFSFMSKSVDRATYVELQPDLVELAQHNFRVLDIHNVTIVRDDGVNYLDSLQEQTDIVYLDPARRNNSGGKTVFIEDCTPNLLEIDTILNLKAKQTIIKLSPMLDIALAVKSLTNITDIHIISVANDCKELVLIKSRSNNQSPKTHCVNFSNSGHCEIFIMTEEQEKSSNVSYIDTVLDYLYEPNSSILKAGAYKSVGNVFGLKKLHPNSHLYTSESFVADFPGRCFSVKKIISPNKKEIKKHIPEITHANISTRNYPFSVKEIRKQTKIKEGGNSYIFATTLCNEKKVLILCQKIDSKG